ncbi:hypothetical protein PINS_up000530 [Pythium insidiosum]|nr:hypothetical protein PINS_up000530 [Pythium insidiosum]
MKEAPYADITKAIQRKFYATATPSKDNGGSIRQRRAEFKRQTSASTTGAAGDQQDDGIFIEVTDSARRGPIFRSQILSSSRGRAMSPAGRSPGPNRGSSPAVQRRASSPTRSSSPRLLHTRRSQPQISVPSHELAHGDDNVEISQDSTRDLPSSSQPSGLLQPRTVVRRGSGTTPTSARRPSIVFAPSSNATAAETHATPSVMEDMKTLETTTELSGDSVTRPDAFFEHALPSSVVPAPAPRSEANVTIREKRHVRESHHTPTEAPVAHEAPSMAPLPSPSSSMDECPPPTASIDPVFSEMQVTSPVLSPSAPIAPVAGDVPELDLVPGSPESSTDIEETMLIPKNLNEEMEKAATTEDLAAKASEGEVFVRIEDIRNRLRQARQGITPPQSALASPPQQAMAMAPPASIMRPAAPETSTRDVGQDVVPSALQQPRQQPSSPDPVQLELPQPQRQQQQQHQHQPEDFTIDRRRRTSDAPLKPERSEPSHRHPKRTSLHSTPPPVEPPLGTRQSTSLATLRQRQGLPPSSDGRHDVHMKEGKEEEEKKKEDDTTAGNGPTPQSASRATTPTEDEREQAIPSPRRRPGVLLQPELRSMVARLSSRMVLWFAVSLGAVFGLSGLLQAASKVRDANDYHQALVERINEFESSIVESYEAMKKMDEKYAVWTEYVREMAEEDESNALLQLESIQLQVQRWQLEMKQDLLEFKQSLSSDMIDAALAPLRPDSNNNNNDTASASASASVTPAPAP